MSKTYHDNENSTRTHHAAVVACPRLVHHGGDIKTVETTARGGDTFKQRCEWCDKQIVRRGTGGELTVLAESGSGTLAGNAHQETFRMLAAGEGAEISESFNRQMSRRLLDRHFPGRPYGH